MATPEVGSNRLPPILNHVRNRVRGWTRDAFRGYTDQDVQNHMAAATGKIPEGYRESYQKRRLDQAYFLGGGYKPIMMIADPTITRLPDTDSAIASLHQETDRIKALTPEQLDNEIIEDAKKWLPEHNFPVPRN